jgi:transposase
MKTKNLSYRSLAKLLDDPVSYQTVRAIVKKYRNTTQQ